MKEVSAWLAGAHASVMLARSASFPKRRRKKQTDFFTLRG
jgi:hypothetical protein